MNQGQSAATRDKERQIGAMFSMERNIVEHKPSILRGHPLHYIDLNAGSGFNKSFQCPGSPVMFSLVMVGFPYRAVFIDKDPEATRQLKEYFHLHPGIEIRTQDNRQALIEITSSLPYYAVGMILADPNSWAYRNQNGDGIPVKELADFCATHPRMDLLMNLNVRVLRMMDAHNRNPNGDGPKYPGLIALDDFPSVFYRQFWLISGLSDHGTTRFVRLVGRNWRYGDYVKWGWYHWDSPTGQRIREDIRTPKKDRDFGQGDLSLQNEAL